MYVCVLTFPNHCQKTVMTTEVGMCLLFFEVGVACLNYIHLTHRAGMPRYTCTIMRDSILTWSDSLVKNSNALFSLSTPTNATIQLCRNSAVSISKDYVHVMLPPSLCL